METSEMGHQSMEKQMQETVTDRDSRCAFAKQRLVVRVLQQHPHGKRPRPIRSRDTRRRRGGRRRSRAQGWAWDGGQVEVRGALEMGELGGGRREEQGG